MGADQGIVWRPNVITLAAYLELQPSMVFAACNIGLIGKKMHAKANTATTRYPGCLELPDLAGRVRVRKPKTEAAYRKGYAWLCKRVARVRSTAMTPEPTTVADVAQWLVQVASTLRPSSYRQYRAAALQELRDLRDARGISLDRVEQIAASMLLSRGPDQSSPYAPKRLSRTSAGKAKSIHQSKAARLCEVAAARVDRNGANLADYFTFGPKCGLRISEWNGTVLEGTALKIPCGKFSIDNGRGIAPYRTQQLDLAPGELDRLGKFLQRLQLQIQEADGRCDLVMRRLSRLLRAVRKDIDAPRVTLRTVRHQFTANLRAAGYSREERAAALGHAAADTSDDHYGKKNRGWRLLRRWIELPKELTERVRPGAKTASKIARGLPLTRSEWVANQLPKPGI
jgi:integrase